MFVTVCAIIAGILVRRVRPHDLLDIDDPASLFGLAAVLTGVFLRSWAASILEKGSVLATEGPYRLCRHPLYAGSFLVIVGYCTLLGDWLSTIVLLTAIFVSYPITIVREEEYMMQKFGDDWQRYCQEVFRFMPSRFPRTCGPVALWKWLQSHEYKAALSAIGGLYLIELWRRLSM